MVASSITLPIQGGKTVKLATDEVSSVHTLKLAGFVLEGTLVAGLGAFLWTGQDANLEWHQELAAGAGAFLWTGSAATLTYSPIVGPSDYTLSAAGGTFNWTGSSLSTLVDREILGSFGAFVWAGSDNSLEHHREVVGGAGSFAFTGSNATLTYTPAAGLTLGTLVARQDNFGYAGTTYSFTAVDTEDLQWLLFAIQTTEGGIISSISVEGGAVTPTLIQTGGTNAHKMYMADVTGYSSVTIAVTSDASINDIGLITLPVDGIAGTTPSGGAIAGTAGNNANPINTSVTVPTGGFIFSSGFIGETTSPSLTNGGTLAHDPGSGKAFFGIVKSGLSGSQTVGVNCNTNFIYCDLLSAAFGE